MAYREPSTRIILYRDIPLDPDYNNTVYWESEEALSLYFVSKLEHAIQLDNQSYQRVETNKMRIQARYENVARYNYLTIENVDYSHISHTFFAFITGANYVNERTTEITYEIDVMTTFFFNYTMQRCWVTRETAASEDTSAQYTPENLYVGDYIQNGITFSLSPNTSTDYYYCDENDNHISVSDSLMPNKVDNLPVVNICCSSDLADPNLGTVDGVFLSNVYEGCNIYAFTMNDTDDVKTINENLATLASANKSDSVVAIFMSTTCTNLICVNSGSKLSFVTNEGGVGTAHYETNTVPNSSEIDGYTPRNKKLLKYPYNYLELTSTSGETKNLQFELFGGLHMLQPTIALWGMMDTSPSITAAPKFYKSGEFKATGNKSYLSGINADITNSVSLYNFPVCSWTFDGFRAWWAQNNIKTVASGANSFISAVGNILSGNILGAVTGGLTDAISIAGEIGQASTLPPISKGNTDNGIMQSLYNIMLYDIFTRRMSIRKERAQVLDDYFDRFGYATHRLKVPNRNVRPHWTYTQTKGCAINGNLPSWAIAKIQSIYDKGVTFWKNPDEIGDYGLDNTL